MKFVLDAGLPPHLAKALVRKGHVAWHVADCGLLSAKDRDIRRFAAREGAAVITADCDVAAPRDGPPVVRLRFGPIGDEALEKALLSALPQIAAAIEAREDVVDVCAQSPQSERSHPGRAGV